MALISIVYRLSNRRVVSSRVSVLRNQTNVFHPASSSSPCSRPLHPLTSHTMAAPSAAADITKAGDIQNARRIIEDSVGEKGLNLLINNAGAVRWQSFNDITEENLLFHFTTNTVGPVMVLKEMLPLLRKSAANKTDGLSVSRSAVLNISSTAGSITTLSPSSPLGTDYLKVMGYRVSKSALNMAMKVAALTMTNEPGILLVNMCPGWVKTNMGTDRAILDVWDSVSDIIKTLPTLNESHHGTFLDRHGNTIPY
ncbi:C-factor [Araneus ventricosus]|uniref:C-factor n=1 Tax=Araneus ventricosus TaxID=182803 RepID=A0A4Y2D5D7_ARAVE|nr:C-factor [Araneus ventricosus]